MSAPGDAWASSLAESLRASLREAAESGRRTLASVTVAGRRGRPLRRGLRLAARLRPLVLLGAARPRVRARRARRRPRGDLARAGALRRRRPGVPAGRRRRGRRGAGRPARRAPARSGPAASPSTPRAPRSSTWSSFSPASMVPARGLDLPRRGGVLLTVNAGRRPGRRPRRRRRARRGQGLAACGRRRWPLIDPHRDRARRRSAAPARPGISKRRSPRRPSGSAPGS